MRKSKIYLGVFGLAIGYGLYRASRPKVPHRVQPIMDFDINSYLGKWYEIARLDNRYERGLIQTTAEYSMHWTGRVKVINQGFDPWESRFKRAIGKAKFIGDTRVGALKVSFFGPFYGGYNIVDLDSEYRWAIVVGSSRRFFWALAREPHIDEELRHRIVSRAIALGIHPDELVWVLHDVTA